MDADQIRRLKPELTRYLDQFYECFARRDTRAHFPVYVEGQLSELPAKSCEPMALAADGFDAAIPLNDDSINAPPSFAPLSMDVTDTSTAKSLLTAMTTSWRWHRSFRQ
jgi:hypothetical protein